MILNQIQHARELEKDKPKIRAAKKRQKEIEKNGTWIRVEGEIKPYYKFVPNKKKNEPKTDKQKSQ